MEQKRLHLFSLLLVAFLTVNGQTICGRFRLELPSDQSDCNISSQLDMNSLETALQKLYGPGLNILNDYGHAETRGDRSRFLRDDLPQDLTRSDSSTPRPLSVLMNFGLDGTSQWIMSTDEWQNDCPEGYIFDPNAMTCRPAICIPVQNTNGDLATCDSQEVRRTIRIAANATDATIFLSLGVPNSVLNKSPQSDVICQDESDIAASLRTEIAAYLNISLEQVTNVTVPDFAELCNAVKEVRPNSRLKHIKPCDVRVVASFELIRDKEHENTSDSIVKLYDHLAHAVISEQNFVFIEDLMDVKVFAIWEEESAGLMDVAQSATWCTMGNVVSYCNDEFAVHLDGPRTSVTINATGMTYYRGQFMLQIFLKELNGKAFSSSVALICEKFATCPDNAPMFVADGAELLPNMSLVYLGTLYEPSQYREYHETNQYLLCGVLKSRPASTCVMGLNASPTLSHISTTLSSISIAALVATLIIYGICPELRTLPGWNLMNMMIALVIAQLALLLNTAFADNSMCAAVGIVTHFAYLASFFLANVIAIDIYHTFGRGRSGVFRLSSRDGKGFKCRLLKNLAYCYISAGSIVGAALILDKHQVPGWEVAYERICWIAGERASLMFFALPIIVITAVNGGLVGVTFYRMRKEKKQSLKDLRLSQGKIGAKNSSRREAVSYVRIGVIFGFTWIFGILSGIVSTRAGQDKANLVIYEIMTYAFVITQSCQGVLIFLSFGINATVRAKLANLRGRLLRRRCGICNAVMCRCISSSVIKHRTSERASN